MELAVDPISRFYYNIGIGRFTQEDVIYNDGLNLYAYCSSNPVMYADPSGYQSNKNQGNLNPCEITKSAAENSKSGKNSELIDIYNSIKESPNYPSNFETVKNGTKKYC